MAPRMTTKDPGASTMRTGNETVDDVRALWARWGAVTGYTTRVVKNRNYDLLTLQYRRGIRSWQTAYIGPMGECFAYVCGRLAATEQP